MNRDELIVKINTMNIDQLWTYLGTAKGANRALSVLGISILFFMIMFYNIFTIVVGSIFVYVLAQLSSGICVIIEIIEERIVSLVDK